MSLVDYWSSLSSVSKVTHLLIARLGGRVDFFLFSSFLIGFRGLGWSLVRPDGTLQSQQVKPYFVLLGDPCC